MDGVVLSSGGAKMKRAACIIEGASESLLQPELGVIQTQMTSLAGKTGVTAVFSRYDDPDVAPPPTVIAKNTSGVHVSSVGAYDGYGLYLQACKDAGWPVGLVKAVDTDGVLMQAKSVSANTTTIYRCKIDGEDFPPANWNWPNSEACHASAIEWMNKCNAKWNPLRPIVDYFDLVNEPNMATVEQVNWFIEWTNYCMDIAADMGYRLAIG
jgi:hypothetical protein